MVVVPSWRKSAVILGMKSSKLLFWAIVAGVAPIAFATPAAAEMAAAPSRPTPDILQDYTYGYAPVVMTATRSVNTAVPDASSSPGRAPIDQFARLKMLATPAARLVRRPNADTLYTLAWFDLAKEPIVLHVPDTAGRYYLIPLYDAYSNEFASIGSRTTGNGEGDFAIVGPLWQGHPANRKRPHGPCLGHRPHLGARRTRPRQYVSADQPVSARAAIGLPPIPRDRRL